MKLPRRWKTISMLATLPVAVSALSVLVLGHPLFMSFAHSGSMEPTLGVGDVFFMQPYPGETEVGDIILFRSSATDALTVHRVVDVTPYGYVTQGDANEVADQTMGEAPVPADKVLGRVIVFNGQPVLVPKLGLFVLEGQGALRGLTHDLGGPVMSTFVLVMAVGLLELFVPRDRALRPSALAIHAGRWFLRLKARLIGPACEGRHLAVGVAILIALGSAAAVSTSDARLDLGFAVNGENVMGPEHDVPAGVLTRTVGVDAMRWLPTHIHVEASDGLHVEQEAFRLAPGTEAAATVSYVGPATAGYHAEEVVVWHYLPVLPADATESLADVDPRLPAALPGLAALLLVGFAMWVGRLSHVRIECEGGRDTLPLVQRARRTLVRWQR